MGMMVAAFSASALTAAAADKPPQVVSGLPKSFNGVWLITAVFPVRPAAAKTADPHLGAVVTLKPDEVSDIDGRRCAAPRFATKRVKYPSLGLKPAAGTAEQLQITCASRPFANLVLIRGKALPAGQRSKGNAPAADALPALLVQRSEAFYLLQRQDEAQLLAGNKTMAAGKAAQPAPAMSKPATAATPIGGSKAGAESKPRVTAPGAAQSHKPQPLASSIPPRREIPSVALLQSDVSGAGAKQAATRQSGKVATGVKSSVQMPAAKAVTTAPKPGTAIQLASYPGLPAATAGWKSLHSTYSELTSLRPLYVADNQQSVRLFATGVGPEKLRQICGDLQSKQAYCTLSQ